PTIEVVRKPAEAPVGSTASRRGFAAVAALALAPQAALAAGVGLLAAGTASSIYLWAQPPGRAARTSRVAAHLPSTGHSPVTSSGAVQPKTSGSPHTESATQPAPASEIFVGTQNDGSVASANGSAAFSTSSPSPPPSETEASP